MSNLNDYLDKSFGKNTTSSSSGGSNLSKYLDENFNPKSGKNLKAEQYQYDQATQYANSNIGLLGNALKATPGILLGGAQSLVNEPYNQLLVKPAMSVARLVGTGIGSLVGGQTGANIKAAAQKPISVPGPIGGEVINQPQKTFGQGGATQIASDALKTGSWLAPVGRVEAGVSSLIKGEALKTIASGFTGGSIYGGLGGAGEALAKPDWTAGSVATDTVMGAATMGVLGAGLGGLGVLARKRASDMVQSAIDVAPKTGEVKITPPLQIPKNTEYQNIPVTKPLAVRSAEPNATPVNVQTPYLTLDQMPTIQMGEKPKTLGIDVANLEAPTLPKTNTERVNALSQEDRAKVLSDTRSLYGKGFSYESAQNKALARFEFTKQDGKITTVVDTPVVKETKTPILAKPKPAEAIQPKEAPLKVVPIKETKVVPPVKPAEIAKIPKIKSVAGTGETKVRGLSAHVEAKAIENGLVQKLADLPEYETVNLKDQATKVAEHINTDYVTARAIALGEKQPPKGLLPESYFVAMEKIATDNADVQLIHDLAHSKLSDAATTMGQRIRTLGERGDYSVTQTIHNIQSARETAIFKGKDLRFEDLKSFNTHIEKKAFTKNDMVDFIKNIKPC